MTQINVQKYESKEEIRVEKNDIVLLISCLALGLLFNLLFFDKALGLSYPLYAIALYVVLLWQMWKNQQLKFDANWLLAIPIMALSFSYLFFSNQIFTVLNFLIIPLLLIAHTLLLTANNQYQWYEAQFLVDLLYGMTARALGNILKPFSLIANLAQQRTNLRKFSVVGRILVGLVIAIPLLLIIVPLLAAADDVFKYFIELIPNVFKDINLNRFIVRSLIVSIITCLVFSYLWSLFRGKAAAAKVLNGIKVPSNPRTFLDPITVTTMLVLIDALYMVFIAIQFSYLFGSLTGDLPQHLTYAQYARKGFFELVAVTVINLAVLLGNINLVKTSGNVIDKVVKVLNTILVVSTAVMLLSAHFRMSLYEAAYGFTYLRVLTHAFMGYLLILFIVTMAKIWRQTVPLLKSYIIVSLIAYSLINYINIDRLIANNNIERYNQGNPIDIAYLTELSYDAMPQLMDFIKNTPDRELAGKLENQLKGKKEQLTRHTPWQSFNISKYMAQKALSGESASK